MNTRFVAVVLATFCALPGGLAAKEKAPRAPAAPIGWLDLQAGSHELSVSEENLQKATRHLAPGSLLPVFKTKVRRGTNLAQVRALNLQTGVSELGWTEASPAEIKPVPAYSSDSELLRLLGPAYYDDFTASHTYIARFILRQSSAPPALLCYVLTPPLSMAKLAVFTPGREGYSLISVSTIPITEMDTGITSIEVRDLLGDGSDCAIIKEAFREQAQTFGTNLYIRKLVAGKLQDLWQAPIQFHNLSQYSPQMQILQPPEQNIGASGTVTTAEVTFRASGKVQEPVWKGKVEFFVIGREKPLDTVNIERACPWNGREFAALR